MVEINDLTFKYSRGKKNSLENINLKIEKGEFIGIIGESGAGKSTLCSCINGIIPHRHSGDFYGSVKVCGKDTFDIKPGELALSVGSVFQDVESQLVSFFVEDEILFGLENFGVPKDKIEERITEALKAVGIENLRYREISGLSGGQKQKVAIAAIVALEPDILVLDEPTGELDPASSLQIFELLKKLNEEKGITIIVAEQKIMLLCEFAKKLCVMQQGKILFNDEVRKVLSNRTELENAGINCPRVLTLSDELFKQKIVKNSQKKKSVCINAEEAASLVRSIL
ncbi:MAG: ABC transporter ATP-binding protein [Treponema sp.]|nr:ABC transporter ATP-binding protein [Treponema sp.]